MYMAMTLSKMKNTLSALDNNTLYLQAKEKSFEIYFSSKEN